MSKHRDLKAAPAAASTDSRLLSKRDAAQYLGLCERSVDEIEKRGDITPVLVPGFRKKLYDVKELDALIESWRSRPGRAKGKWWKADDQPKGGAA